jgi:hypothetical protein
MILVLPNARRSEGESPSRLMVKSSSSPSRRLAAASGYSRSSHPARSKRSRAQRSAGDGS